MSNLYVKGRLVFKGLLRVLVDGKADFGWCSELIA